MNLPVGVELIPLKTHADARGSLTEIFRDEWCEGFHPCQWNVTFSHANVLRGVHVHYKHSDYLVLLQGRISVGLHDARSGSQSYRTSCVTEIESNEMSVLRIPAGMMHGFYCHEPSLYIYGVNSYFDPDDELGCYWADPALGIAWPCREPLLNERDIRAGTLADVEARLHDLNPEFAKPAF
jgi:dTDP-4-dehydrorhamnose 3,5-epimerase